MYTRTQQKVEDDTFYSMLSRNLRILVSSVVSPSCPSSSPTTSSMKDNDDSDDNDNDNGDDNDADADDMKKHMHAAACGPSCDEHDIYEDDESDYDEDWEWVADNMGVKPAARDTFLGVPDKDEEEEDEEAGARGGRRKRTSTSVLGGAPPKKKLINVRDEREQHRLARPTPEAIAIANNQARKRGGDVAETSSSSSSGGGAGAGGGALRD